MLIIIPFNTGWRLRAARPTAASGRQNKRSASRQAFNMRCCGGKSVNPFEKDFFTDEQQAVTVADRYPQDVFAEHTHEFCELVMVWRGNGLHVLNERPYRITRGDLFYIRAEDKHSYTSVNDLVLQNIIYCPERLKLNVNWQAMIPGFQGAQWHPHWRLGSMGMNQARQVINQLEHESNGRDPLANEMAELLFGQLVMTLKRHRYATDDLPATSRETLLDKLITALANSLECPFALDAFCQQEQCSERVLRQQFRAQTGMTINQYLRQSVFATRSICFSIAR